MKSRERLLAIVVAALVALIGLRAGVTYVSDSFAERETRLETANRNVRDKQLEVAKGNKAASQLKKWGERSLPSDRPVATSLYQKWLLEIATKASGLRNAHVAAEGTRESAEGRRFGAAQNAAPTYQQLSFTLNGSGSLTQIVRLLHAFHSANHLHRISVLKIEPAEQGSDLVINMRIEALILSRTTRTDSLNKDKSDRLAFGDLAAYEKAIVGRNLFAEYKPPPPPVQERPRVVEVPRKDPPKPAFDHAKHAEITGIVGQGDQSQLWLRVKTTDEELKLTEGEEFSVGDMKCKVVRIGLREAELATGDRHFIMRLKDNLRDAASAKSSEL
jgi:hypothetical protein